MFDKICKKQFLDLLLTSSIIVFILHYIALVYDLYWVIEWYDIPMHFLGGFTMGILATFIFFTSGYLPEFYKLRHNKFVVFVIIIMFTSVIGLGWELWELFVGFSDVVLDRIDTIKDLIMNTFGAIFAYFFLINKIK